MKSGALNGRFALPTATVLLGALALTLPAGAQGDAQPVGAAQDYFSVKPVDGQAPLDFPTARVPGRALLKLEAAPGSFLALQATGALEARTGIALQLVRASVLGWGLYDIVELAKPNTRPDEARTLELIELLRGAPEVRGASDERWYQKLTTPSDPGFPAMWHLEDIGAETAWDTTTGLSSQRIGVVDTGTLRDHEELASRAVAGYDFISSVNAAADGNGRDADYLDNGDGADCGQGFRPSSFHGTHVAGTILAEPNNGAGIAGLNWSAGLVTARALGRCGGSLADIMEGAAWMAGADVANVPALDPADRVTVMNLSLGGADGCSGFEQDVIDFITGQGVVFVAAAGNDAGPVGSPANCTGVISVAAHGPEGALSSYSSFGTSIEVVAPGGDIVSDQDQAVLSASGPNDDDYAWNQGTSMAAPHVTGAVSLMQVFAPSLDRATLAQLFIDTGGTCTNCQGVPTLQLDALLDAVSSGGPAPEPEPEPEPEPTPEPADDAYEPNDAWDGAPTLACGASVDLVMAAGNADWFKLEVQTDTLLNISIDGGSTDFDLYLTDGPTNEDVIGSSTTPTGIEQVVMAAPVEELAVVIVPWEDAAGTYSLSVGCTVPEPEPTPEPEPSPEPEPTPEPDASPEPDVEPTDPDDPTLPTDPGDEDNPGNGGGQDPVDDEAQPAGPGSPGGEVATSAQLTPAVEGGATSGCSQTSASGLSTLAVLLFGLALPRRRRRT